MLRHLLDHVERRAADHTDLGAALHMWEANAVIEAAVPGSLQAQHLHSAETGQQCDPERAYGLPPEKWSSLK